MSLDEMADMPDQWPLLRDLIMSGQVEEDRFIVLFKEHDDFCNWFVGDRRPAWEL